MVNCQGGLLMRDPGFAALLRDVVSVWRPEVSVSWEGDPRTPVYALVASGVPCALQPVSDSTRETLLGDIERATHVAYLQPTDLRAGDWLAEEAAGDVLAAPAAQGGRAVTVAHTGRVARGDRLCVGADSGAELVLAGDANGVTASLATALRYAHAAGESVSVVVAYEVLGVRDEAGQGHHLRVDLRKLIA